MHRRSQICYLKLQASFHSWLIYAYCYKFLYKVIFVSFGKNYHFSDEILKMFAILTQKILTCKINLFQTSTQHFWEPKKKGGEGGISYTYLKNIAESKYFENAFFPDTNTWMKVIRLFLTGIILTKQLNITFSFKVKSKDT